MRPVCVYAEHDLPVPVPSPGLFSQDDNLRSLSSAFLPVHHANTSGVFLFSFPSFFGSFDWILILTHQLCK